jgi:uncharacterized membrane protein YccC
MHLPLPSDARTRRALRIALSYYATNGLAAALGLLVISGAVHLLLGAAAASAASVGVIVCIPPDAAAPRRGKFWQLLPAALFGLPLFFAVQALHTSPLLLGLVLVPATFLAFLAGAWGKRGLPITMSIMFAMVFSMAMPQHAASDTALTSSMHFALGAVAYLMWATLANTLLNARYRALMLADTFLALAGLMRTQAAQFVAAADEAGTATSTTTVGQLLQKQAALADQLQAARDLLLESPRTPRRQRLAGLLIHVLELRDHLLACELDLDALKSHAGHAADLNELRVVLEGLAEDVEQLADALLTGQPLQAHRSRRPRLAAPTEPALTTDAVAAPSTPSLARSLANRVGHVDAEVSRTIALARGDTTPDLAAVRVAWQLFVSPTAWSWRPFAALWRWDAPPLRHAVRAALAIASAYALSLALPWGTHDYWILLTIVVVLRGSLAQTLERRNSRAAGTLLGCLLAAALLWMHLPPWLLLLVLTLAQAVAHAFAPKRYLVTAIAATVLGLVQSHLINVGGSPVFDMVERLADTLLGVVIAWGFSYVLPSWERHQIPALVARTLAAQARHARVALGLGQFDAVDNEPELEWRLARREAYDSLSALVQATQRSLAEPRAVRPPLEPLERLLAHSYQLLAQLTAVKTMLLLQRGQLRLASLRASLAQAAETIEARLTASAAIASAHEWPDVDAVAMPPPDSADGDLSPWALRRLALATEIAGLLRTDADEVRQAP